MAETGPELRSSPTRWWVISESAVLSALRRVAEGENPDLVYAELYANAEHEHHG